MTLLTAHKKEDCLCNNCIHINFCEFKTIKDNDGKYVGYCTQCMTEEDLKGEDNDN